jgi:TatD DNase family protein
VPYRGKTNSPAYVPHVAACLAQLKGVSVDTVAAATTENFRRLFSKTVGPVPASAAPAGGPAA